MIGSFGNVLSAALNAIYANQALAHQDRMMAAMRIRGMSWKCGPWTWRT